MKEKLNAKLIVSDFDGTLINSNQQVTQEVKDAINRYVEDGGIFVVITGRMIASILPQVRKLGLKGLVAGYQGTVIADIESGKIIRNGGFTVEQTAEICQALKEFNAYINIYHDDKLYTDIPKDNKHLQLYESITGITANGVLGNMSDFVRENKMACQKVTSLCYPKDKLPLYNKLCERFAGKYDITYSADVLVEISPLGDNKGEALKFIANHYNIPISQTVAIGDNLNDLPMIVAAGVGVAVGNATQPLKQKADYISATNDDGGVAEVIKKFGYNN
jgi:hypothetical protein